MALIFIDSFDHYQTADISRKWTANAFNSIGTTAGRRGTQGMLCNSGSATANLTVPAQTTYVMGAAISRPTNTARGNCFRFMEGATTHVVIACEPGGFVSAYRGSPTTNLLGISTESRIRVNQFVYIEAKVFIHATLGTVEIRVNGEVLLNLTNQDTDNAGAVPTINGVQVAGNITFDDLYICDILTALNNDFLGDCEIEAVLPDGAGNATQFTTLVGAATHWQAVNESPAIDDDTSYVETATNTHLDQFTYANLSAISGGSTVLGVQVVTMARADSGAATMRAVAREGGADFNGGNVVLGTGWVGAREIWEQNPNGPAAWTDTTFNGAEFGVEKVA